MDAFKDKATLWRSGELNEFSEASFAPPEIINVRWQDGSKSFVASDGTEFISRSIIYCKVDLSINDYIIFGENKDHPSPPTGAMPVRAFMRSKSHANGRVSRKAIL